MGDPSQRFCREPVVLVPERLVAIERASVAVSNLVHRTLTKMLGGDLDRIAEWFGVEGGVGWLKLLMREPTGLDAAFFRPDIVETAHGPKCLEVNGPNAGGWSISTIADRHLDGRRAVVEDTTLRLFRSIARRSLRRRSSDLHLVVTVGPDAEEEFGPIVRDRCEARWREALSREGGRSGRLSFARWDELEIGDGEARCRGVRIDALLEEHVETVPARMQIVRAWKRGQLDLFCGPITALLNDKRNLALLSQLADEGDLDPTDREIVRAYVPWTRKVGASLEDRILRERPRFVLKKATSFGGKHVLIGRSTPEHVWREAIARARSEGDWIAQELVTPSSSDGREIVWGAFVIDGTFAGGFGRVLERDGYRPASAPNGSLADFTMERSMNGDDAVELIPISYEEAA